MNTPPPLQFGPNGLRLGPIPVEILHVPNGLALLLRGYRLSPNGTLLPTDTPNLPTPLGTLDGPPDSLPDRWARGFSPDLQNLLNQILEAATLLLPTGHPGGYLLHATLVAPDDAPPFPLLPNHSDLLPNLLAPALARVGSLICHARRPLPLPKPPTSTHDRLRRIQRLLQAITHPHLSNLLHHRLTHANANPLAASQ